MKKSTPILSLKQARILALRSQGLLKPNFGTGKKATLAAIELSGKIFNYSFCIPLYSNGMTELN